MPFQCIVKNFLAAKEVKFTVKGFTLIKGESSSGKSSSFKAIYAACTNSFSPSQVRFGTDEATVRLRFAPDEPVLSVIRKRKGSPTMIFNGKEYSRMNRAVPEEIDKYLNLGFIQAGSEKYSLNFFTQFQPPLLHTFSQRRIAEILSNSAALDDYNAIMKEMAQKREQLKGAFSSIDNLMTDIKERSSRDGALLEAMQPLVESLEELYRAVLSSSGILKSLESLLYDVASVSFMKRGLALRSMLVETYKSWERIQSESDLLLSLMTSLRRAAKKSFSLAQRRKLDGLLSDAEIHAGLVEELKTYQQEVTRYNSIKSSMSSRVELRALYSEAVDLFTARESIETTLQLLHTFKQNIKNAEYLRTRIEEGKAHLHADVCPFCGSIIVDKDMNKDEIVAKRKALEAQIRAEENDLLLLESRIKENAETLGIKPNSDAISAAIQKNQEQLSAKENEIESLLAKIQALENAPAEEARPVAAQPVAPTLDMQSNPSPQSNDDLV